MLVKSFSLRFNPLVLQLKEMSVQSASAGKLNTSAPAIWRERGANKSRFLTVAPSFHSAVSSQHISFFFYLLLISLLISIMENVMYTYTHTKTLYITSYNKHACQEHIQKYVNI